MNRLMEEDSARHVKAIHYSASIDIHVCVGEATSVDINLGFWPVVLETFSKRKLKKGKAHREERRGKDQFRRRRVPDLRGSN